jgi:hypothetical protein
MMAANLPRFLQRQLNGSDIEYSATLLDNASRGLWIVLALISFGWKLEDLTDEAISVGY